MNEGISQMIEHIREQGGDLPEALILRLFGSSGRTLQYGSDTGSCKNNFL
jgi:hypothetical protein